MLAIAAPLCFALFVWWFSTAIIIYLDGLRPATFRWSMLGASFLALASLAGIWLTRADTGLAAAYAAFSFGIILWGWQLVSFYMSYVTGPRSTPCPAGLTGWRHFIEALRTSLWHEFASIAGALLVAALTWGEPNQIGLWTYLVLWWMHVSAKLNIYFGVPNLGEDLLPDHLRYLQSFMRKKPMNLLFPVSVTLSTIATLLLAQKAAEASSGGFENAGCTMLATLMALAILEHWFLVIPLSQNALWSWGLKTHEAGRDMAPVLPAQKQEKRAFLLPSHTGEGGPA